MLHILPHLSIFNSQFKMQSYKRLIFQYPMFHYVVYSNKRKTLYFFHIVIVDGC